MDPVEQLLGSFVVLGVPAVVLIPLLVEGLKRYAGLPTRWAGVAAVALGLAAAGLSEAVEVWPEVTPWVRVVVGGVVLGLASAGVYSQYRALRSEGGSDL